MSTVANLNEYNNNNNNKNNQSLHEFYIHYCNIPIPVAARSKAWVCGRTLAGIRTDHSSRGDLLNTVYLIVIKEPHGGSLGPLGVSSREKINRNSHNA